MAVRYHKPEPGPEKLGEILGKLFVARGWGRKQERLKLEKAWMVSAGEDYAPLTKVSALKKGILEVLVANSALLQELAQFQKRSILARLRVELSGVEITDLRFRYGKID
jgi:hypothetical protein